MAWWVILPHPLQHMRVMRLREQGEVTANIKYGRIIKNGTGREELKCRLVSALILALRNDSTNTSWTPMPRTVPWCCPFLGAEWIQSEQERVIAFASRRYADAGLRYCIIRHELLAVVYGLQHFRVYLLGRHFQIRTDHALFVWLQVIL